MIKMSNENTKIPHAPVPEHAPLGQKTEYVSEYSADLLFPIARAESRRSLSIDPDNLPFNGVDVWTGYELSWLNMKGKPCVAVAEFQFPCDSPSIVESKSFKLYLNSFNQTRFESLEAVESLLKRDLSVACGAPVELRVSSLSDAQWAEVEVLQGACVDDLDVDIDCYHPQPELLQCESQAVEVSELLYSNLLKSNCPVTGQPDWASIHVAYRGAKICRESLLKYVVSFREHQDFHEHCVERMFVDLMARCKPSSLTVHARYTRRGGLDINPLRSTESGLTVQKRLVRQ
jgi:7-cyano-7-deazaguanine reductase